MFERIVLVIVLLTLSKVNGTPTAHEANKEDGLLFDALEVGSLGGSLGCTLCEDAMKMFHTFLQKPCNQAYLVNLIEKGCQWLPIFKDKCMSLVKEYGTLVLELGVQYINPTLCKTIHLCAAGEASVYKENCKMCELGMGVLYDTLQDPELSIRVKLNTIDLCMDLIDSKQTCVALADNVVAYALPIADELRRSNFFMNACTESEICTE